MTIEKCFYYIKEQRKKLDEFIKKQSNVVFEDVESEYQFKDGNQFIDNISKAENSIIKELRYKTKQNISPLLGVKDDYIQFIIYEDNLSFSDIDKLKKVCKCDKISYYYFGEYLIKIYYGG